MWEMDILKLPTATKTGCQMTTDLGNFRPILKLVGADQLKPGLVCTVSAP